MKEKIISLFSYFLQLSLFKKLVLVGVVLLLGWFGYGKVLAQKSAKPQYQTATAERGTLITSVTSSGTVSSAGNASIATQATGVVTEILVANGDYVNQGDTIAKLSLDQSSQQKQTAAYSSYLSAQNSLNSAKNQMNALQAALFTANQTFVNGAGTVNPITDDPTYIIQRANWLKAETDYNNQKNVIAQSEAALSSAWLSYSQTSAVVTAPIAGYVSNLSITPGLPIAGNTSSSTTTTTASSQTLGSITLKDSKLTATVSLTEIDVTKVKSGQKVTLKLDAFPDKTFTGKVAVINTNGSVSSGVTTYPTTITFDDAPDNIYPNMAVNATIILSIKNDVVLVPVSAVKTANGSSSVQLLKDGKSTSVTVEVGDSSDTQTEIISGVTEGDIVITGTVATGTSTTTQTASPFGGGLGGGRGFGGGGGGNQIRVQR